MAQTGYTLPVDPDPDGYKCVTIQIPNEPAHERAFWGHLFGLARWWKWDRDSAHTGTEAAQRWAKVWAIARDEYDRTGGDCDAIPESPSLSDELVQTIIEQYILSNETAYFDDTENEDENMLQIVHMNGIAYLMEPCACGQYAPLIELAVHSTLLQFCFGCLSIPSFFVCSRFYFYVSTDCTVVSNTWGLFFVPCGCVLRVPLYS